MSWMSRHKPLIILWIISTGLMLTSLLLAFISNGYLVPLFFIALSLWGITLFGSLLYFIRKDLRAFLSALGLNLIGAPFAIFLASRLSGLTGSIVFLFTMAL